MSWQLTEAVDEFLAEAGEFLHVERARNTVILTVTEMVRVGGGTTSAVAPLLGWWRAGHGDAVSGVFMHTPQFPVMLSAMPADAVGTLAKELAGAGRALPGVNAQEQAAQAFAAVWQDCTGAAARMYQRMRLFRLGELVWPEPVPDGAARIATLADRDLLISWFDAFSEEAGDFDTNHGAAVDDRLSYGGMTLWQVAGRPAALAGVTRTVAGMIRVGPVYTPPELRGRGYAGAATATVSQAALDAGATDVLLYTDLANPTSNALYQRIGYRPVEDRVVLSFG